jgi:hypothetical protein
MIAVLSSVILISLLLMAVLSTNGGPNTGAALPTNSPITAAENRATETHTSSPPSNGLASSSQPTDRQTATASPSPLKPPTVTYLISLQPETNSNLQEGAERMGKMPCEHSLAALGPYDGSARYRLDRQYRRFKADFIAADESSSYGARLVIGVDGSETERKATAGHPVTIDLDVSEVGELKIEIYANFWPTVLCDAQLDS